MWLPIFINKKYEHSELLEEVLQMLILWIDNLACDKIIGLTLDTEV